MIDYIREKSNKFFFITIDERNNTLIIRRRIIKITDIETQKKLLKEFLDHFYQNVIIASRVDKVDYDINQILLSILNNVNADYQKVMKQYNRKLSEGNDYNERKR